jgi:hypothetical protein
VKFTALLLLLLTTLGGQAYAQSAPTPTIGPGVIWTPQQWVAAWSSKIDTSPATGGPTIATALLGSGTILSPNVLPSATQNTPGILSLTAAGAGSPVQTVAGRTGTIILSHADITDFTAAAVASAWAGSGFGFTTAPTSAGLAGALTGTTAGTLAAGNDSRITGALQPSSVGPLATQAGVSGSAAIIGAIGAVHNVTASGSYAVLVTDLYVCINKATPGATTVLLPPTFNQSSLLNVKDCAGNAATYPITLTPASGTIDGNATVVMAVNYEALTLSYNGSGWSIW